MRLLLAEDEKDLADALEAMLKHNNYSVDVVNNGQDALDYLMLDDYDGAIFRCYDATNGWSNSCKKN